jgi:hypothetical protein
MYKKKSIITMFFICVFISGFIINPDISYAGKLFDETNLITEDTLKFITPPNDFRNYFMLQSIDDTTVILVGNFVGAEKIITLITDKGSDNTIDSIVDYYPDSKKYQRGKTSVSQLVKTDIAEFKKDIIEGVVFDKNYSYQMKSLKTVKSKLIKGKDIFNSDAGFLIIAYDPEKTSTPMNKFYFKIKDNRYDLMFQTIYYKLYNTNIQPPVSFSVYCKDSKDPVVGEYVKELLKLCPQK